MKRATNVLLVMLAATVLIGVVLADMMVMFPSTFDGMMAAMTRLHLGAIIAAMAGVAAQLRALPRSAWFATGGTLLAAVAAAGIVIMIRRARGGERLAVATTRFARKAPSSTKVGSKVLSRATRGESRAEIARHTGLSQDAVRMLLDSVTERAPSRKIRPGAA